jgi:hypothetical protein
MICDWLNEILNSSDIRRHIAGWLVSNETEGMWKEEVVAYSEALCMPLSGIIEEKHKNWYDSLSSGRCLKTGSAKDGANLTVPSFVERDQRQALFDFKWKEME